MGDDLNKSAFGCHLPPPVPSNTVIKDIRGKPWTLGKVLGHGGFGAIYLTQPGKLKSVDDGAEYVVKIEPHDNGPLFVELHALLRLGRESARVDWKPRQGDKPIGWVGLPAYETHGSFRVDGTKLRFLVMTRFGGDLEKVFKAGTKPLPVSAVLNVGIQVLNSLEFIHSHNYCHNDIKAANILLDKDGRDVFLVDFGLACKFKNDQGYHCDGEPDDRKAHDGTLEYTSRDAHTGAHSRRGDLESLGYCMLHWAGARLPWAPLLLGDPELVQAAKETCLADLSTFLDNCFRPSPAPSVFLAYWQNVLELKFTTRPDYTELRRILTEALEQLGSYPHDRLQFSGKTIKVRTRKSVGVPKFLQEEGGRRTRSQVEDDPDSSSHSWDLTDPNSIMREASKLWAEESASRIDPEKEADFNRRQEESLKNPTPEMSRLIAIQAEREEARKGMSWKEQLAEFNRRKAMSSIELPLKATTPQMDEVIALRNKRLSSNQSLPSPEPSDEELVEEEAEDDEDEEEGEEDENDENDEKDCLYSPVNDQEPPPSGRKLRSRGLRATSSSSLTLEDHDSNRIQTRNGGRRRSVPSPAVSDIASLIKSSRLRKRVSKKTSEEPNIPENGFSTPRRSVSNGEMDTPPSNQTSPFRSPNETYVDCEVCDKNLNVKSMARHLRTVHKRSISMTPKNSTGFTPAVKKSRSSKSSPNYEEKEEEEEAEGECPVCEGVMPLSLLTRHYETKHSSSRGLRRGVRRAEDVVASQLAKVSVSSESPEKIRNVDSPALTERRLGNVIASFRRDLD